jgi:hypothetical protein
VKLTGSPLIAPPLESVTLAVTVDVAVPFAGTLVLLSVTATVDATGVVWVIAVVVFTDVPVPPGVPGLLLPADGSWSTTVMVQNPGVVDAV